MSLAASWQRYLKWRLRHVVEIASDSVGFRVANVVIAWADVTKLTAFKRDLLTVDLLCILVETSGGIVEINEEMIGYERFETDLEKAFGTGPEWKLEVLFPAFATNATPIFERPHF